MKTDLITSEDFNFEGTRLEVARLLIKQCNYFDNLVDGATKLIAIERGRGYAYAKSSLKTNVAVAKEFSNSGKRVSEASVREYIKIFNGREILESHQSANLTIKQMAKAADVGSAIKIVGLMDNDIDVEKFPDKELIKMSKMTSTGAAEYATSLEILEAEIVEEPEPVAAEKPEPAAVEDETVYTDSETLMAAFKDKELHCLLTYMEHHISPIEFPVGRVEALQMVLVGSSINRYIKNIGNGGVGGFAFAELQRNETENVKATTEAVFARARLKTAKYRITCAALVMYEIEDPEAVIMFAGIAAMLDFKYFEEISASEIADYKNKIKNIVLGMPKIVAGIDTVNDYLGDECVAKIEDDYKMEKAVEEMTAHKKLIDAAIEKNGVPIKKWGASSLEKLLDIKGMAIQKFLRTMNTKPLAGTNITKLNKYLK